MGDATANFETCEKLVGVQKGLLLPMVGAIISMDGSRDLPQRGGSTWEKRGERS